MEISPTSWDPSDPFDWTKIHASKECLVSFAFVCIEPERVAQQWCQQKPAFYLALSRSPSPKVKLLNSTTIKIEEFFGSAIPKSYAILSHRWEDGEATYQEVGNERAMSQKPGWAKIRKTCSIARDRGFSYVWVDTCCINKQDFSELTEAINSMFKWYADATRGWTLQELIAPNRVEFFDGAWNAVGTREELADAILHRTDIDVSILRERSYVTGMGVREHLDDFPVGVRMSWAAGRVTTRVEDRTYSLMGLFNVNMPLLYGEGDRAFVRLQEEIIKESNDMTLFAWTSDIGSIQYKGTRGILASSPDNFEPPAYSTLVFTRRPELNPEFMATNKGVKISAETYRDSGSLRDLLDPEFYHILPLGCRWSRRAPGSELGILLHDRGDGIWLRAEVDVLLEVPPGGARTLGTLFIRKYGDLSRESLLMRSSPPNEIHFITSPEVQLWEAVPKERWSVQDARFLTAGLGSFTGFIKARGRSHVGGPMVPFVIFCGFDTAADQKLQFWFLFEGREEVGYEAVRAGQMDVS
ncbi:HET domain-containing protein [Colletotrichum sojae]|uniref:HET domain-containing protein n=1 Tax=Colletotrichum sojae TaxID=2175907 RepID=A0A8H6JF77_9PEZI|nr:HET domain-containing protein [Colletotrichum sojae]